MRRPQRGGGEPCCISMATSTNLKTISGCGFLALSHETSCRVPSAKIPNYLLPEGLRGSYIVRGPTNFGTVVHRRAILETAVVGALVGILSAFPALAESRVEDSPGGGPASFGWFASQGFQGAYDALIRETSAAEAAEYLEALAADPDFVPEDIGLGDLSEASARRILEDASETASGGRTLPQSGTAGEVGVMSVSTAPVLGYATNGRYSWRYDDLYTQRYCEQILLPWTCSDSTLSLRFITDPGNTGSRTSLNMLEGGQGRVTSFTLRTIVYSGGANISDVTPRWNTPGSGVQWNTPHVAAAGKTFQVWFKMTIYHSKGDPVTAEWKTAKSSTCRTPTASVAFRCLFP